MNRSETHLEQVQTIADIGSWEYDLRDDRLFWSAKVYDLFRIPDEITLTYEGFLEYVHPDDRDHVEDEWTAALAGEAYDIEHRIVTEDDETRWVRERADIEYDEDGNPTTAIGVVQDITDRKTRERRLTALNDVAVALNTSDSVEAVCERTVDASQAILEFDLSVVDFEEEGYLSKVAISEEIPVDETTRMSVDEGIAGKTYRTGESILIDDIDDYEEANPQGPFRSGISVPIGDHGVFQAVAEETGAFDESDLKLAELLISHTESALDRLEQERQLERQNERLAEFASVVSHDLRNPLNVAQGRLELVRQECDCEHLDVALRAHERMETLVGDLMVLAREGERPIEVEPVVLEEIVGRCWRNVATSEARLAVETDVTIRADRNRLQQLLENLIRNAVEHGGTGVTVTVGDLEDGFYVADDGPGIPEDDREAVFDFGYSTTQDGTGFGLNIVEQASDAHGWDVSVTESGDGGARFEITGVTLDSTTA